MVYRLTCQCGTMFHVDGRVVGKYVTCPNCRQRIHIDGNVLEPVSLYRLACQCGASFRVEDKAIGGTFQCPKCRRKVRIHRQRLSEVLGQQNRVSKSRGSSVPIEFGSDVPSRPT